MLVDDPVTLRRECAREQLPMGHAVTRCVALLEVRAAYGQRLGMLDVGIGRRGRDRGPQVADHADVFPQAPADRGHGVRAPAAARLGEGIDERAGTDIVDLPGRGNVRARR